MAGEQRKVGGSQPGGEGSGWGPVCELSGRTVSVSPTSLWFLLGGCPDTALSPAPHSPQGAPGHSWG